jgi:hypothetical protein
MIQTQIRFKGANRGGAKRQKAAGKAAFAGESQEGGGGFNPRVKTVEIEGASAPEE